MARKLPKTRNENIEESEGLDGEPSRDIEETLHKTISKAAAARDALAAGVVVPKQASVYIKQKYGIDISPQQFSAEKCRLKQRSTDPVPVAEFEFSSSRGGATPGSQFGRDELLEALEVMKPLIDQLGADKVKRMVDLLG